MARLCRRVNMDVLLTGASRDEQILTSGTEIGALLVDGLGDGVLIECPSEDLEVLRLMSFGLLQVWLRHLLACCAWSLHVVREAVNRVGECSRRSTSFHSAAYQAAAAHLCACCHTYN